MKNFTKNILKLKTATNDYPQETKTLYYQLTGLFFFTYFGLGALLPLLTLYLQEKGFSGIEIGSISSIRSIAAIFVPPLWGFLSDRFNLHKRLLMIAIVCTLLVTLGMPLVDTVLTFSIIYALFNAFQCAVNPLSDSIAIHSPIPFGSIRKWGAYGYAIAAALGGILTNFFDLVVIFPLFSISLFISFIFAAKLKFDINKNPLSQALTMSDQHPTAQDDLKILLKNKQFLMFLLYVFLVGNTLITNNTFYGPLFKEVGGTTFYLGIAFFLFAISEAPFMQLTTGLIKRLGIYKVLTFSTSIAILRWFFYSLGPAPIVMIVLFPLQGLFFGTFIASTAEYIKMTVRPSVRSTAIAIYSAVFIGAGAAFSNLVGGFILEYINVFAVYTFLGGLCVLGLIVLGFLKKISTP